jgi:hypothetical protein
MTHKPRNPIQVLAGAQAELKLDMVEEVKRVPTKGIKPFSGYLDQRVEVNLLHLRDYRRATLLKIASIGSR